MINNKVTTKKNKVYYISVKYFLESNKKKQSKTQSGVRPKQLILSLALLLGNCCDVCF